MKKLDLKFDVTGRQELSVLEDVNHWALSAEGWQERLEVVSSLCQESPEFREWWNESIHAVDELAKGIRRPSCSPQPKS